MTNTTTDTLNPSPPSQAEPSVNNNQLPLFNLSSLIQLALGFVGIQFGLSTQIALSQQVLEPLGASPFLYGLVWCVGPLSGLFLQPIIHSLSGGHSGKKNLFILSYSLIAALAIIYFPQAPNLLMAGIALALLDVTLNTAQSSYRSLLPNIVPPQQLPIAHSFTNFAFAFAPVIALSVLPLLQVFNISMTLTQQYQLAGIVLITLVFVGLQAIKNRAITATDAPSTDKTATKANPLSAIFSELITGLSAFVRANGNVRKLCAVQFFTWSGVMCLFIYITPFVVHSIYELPDMSTPSYKKEEALYQLAQKIDANVVTEANYKKLSTVVTAVNTKKQQLIVPTIADISALNNQLDETLKPYFSGTSEQAFSTIKHLAMDKELSEGLSETERVLELKLALLEFPLYEKTLDAQTDSTTVEADQALGAFTTLPILETLDKQEFYADTNTEARSTAMVSLVVFNLVALLLTVPFALLTKKWGKKRLLTLALTCMAISFGFAPFIHTSAKVPVIELTLLGFGFAPFIHTSAMVFCMMAGAGIAWATILSIPFAMLNDHVTQGDERAMMGVFNLFIYMPQFIAALAVGQWIEQSPVQTAFGLSHNWSLAFVFASAMVGIAIILLQTVKEKRV